MNKILFLDCDWTIRQPLDFRRKFISHPRDQQIMHGADKAIESFNRDGWVIVGVTNQGGVASGHKSLNDAIDEQAYTLELFPQMDLIAFCPDFEGEICYQVHGRTGRCSQFDLGDLNAIFPGNSFRKPGTAMIDLLSQNQPDLEKRLMIGDREEDKECAANSGIPFIWAKDWRQEYEEILSGDLCYG